MNIKIIISHERKGLDKDVNSGSFKEDLREILFLVINREYNKTRAQTSTNTLYCEQAVGRGFGTLTYWGGWGEGG
jgi:hypothetical protein